MIFLIAKLHACGFDRNTFGFVYSYLKERKKRVKIDNEYIELQEILLEYHGDQYAGPVLFNSFLSDLFLTLKLYVIFAEKVFFYS